MSRHSPVLLAATEAFTRATHPRPEQLKIVLTGPGR
jgi:hypothetical protein